MKFAKKTYTCMGCKKPLTSAAEANGALCSNCAPRVGELAALERDLQAAADDAAVASVLLRLGDQSSALDRFDQCQRLSPDFDRPFINAALIYKSQGQVPKAQQLLSGFLARHPENEDVRKAYEKLATP